MKTEIDIESEDPTESEAGNEGAALSPGALLNSERERRGWSEKYVADQLHITMHYVRAIESDNYEKLPGSVFARGYIKSYALLLGLDDEQLVALFEGITDWQTTQSASEFGSQRRGKKKKYDTLYWIVFAILAFIIGFLAYYIYHQLFPPRSVIGETGLISPFPAYIEEAVSPQVVAGQIQRLQSVNAAAAGRATGGVIGPNSSVVTAQSGQPDQESLATPPTLRAPAMGRGINSTEYTRGDVSEIIGIGSDRLELSFTGNSLVEISDSHNQRIYLNIQGPGDQVKLTGSAPFEVYLGNASAVAIQLNNTEISTLGNVRIDNSARLLVSF